MAQQTIGIGAVADDGTGDSLRVAGDKINDNFTEIYAALDGLEWKEPVRVATTADGTLASAFDNGSSVDGITLATGDRILIKNQSDQTVNGIYIVAASGSPTRSNDCNTAAELEGIIVSVRQGTINANTAWQQTTDGITLGSSNIVWAAFGSGTGNVTKVGTPVNNQIGVWTGDGTIEGDAELTFDGSVLLVNPTNNGFIQFGDVAAPIVGIDVYAADDGLGGGGARFFMSGSQGYFEIHQDNSSQSLLFYGDDGGLRYGGDYSADFVARTLVDKAYVDAAVLGLPESLVTDTTQTGNVTTGEDTLFTYTLAGGTLATNGNTIHGRVTGTVAANGNVKTLKIKFGATTFLTSVVTTSTITSSWTADFQVIRTGATTQKCSVMFNNPDGQGISVYATAGETLSGNIDIVVTGEATATNDIVREMAKLTFEP